VIQRRKTNGGIGLEQKGHPAGKIPGIMHNRGKYGGMETKSVEMDENQRI
jgi:hypothetical protein